MWPTGGKMIKSLALVWNTTAVFHIIQVTDSYNCQASKTTGQFSTEAWVAVMILYGVMKRVLQHQQFMIETIFFPQQNLFWCFSCCTQSCYCIALKTVISSGPFFYPQFFFFFFIHGYNMPRRLPKQSFHFDWSVLNWGNKDGLMGFGDIVIPFSSFDCSTFQQQSAVIHPLQSSLQRNVFKDILGFVISTPFSERHIVGFLTTIKWLSVSWSCAHWASQTFFFLFYYFSFLSTHFMQTCCLPGDRMNYKKNLCDRSILGNNHRS